MGGIAEMNLITINGVRGFIDETGTAQLNLEDVSRGLGFTQEKNGTEYVRWETVNEYLKSFGFSQLVGKDDFIPENIFYRLSMKAKNDTAENFQIKVADEILPSIRKTGSYSSDKPSYMIEDPVKRAEKWIEEAKEKQLLSASNDKKDQIIGELKPKADYTDSILRNKGLVNAGQIAKDYGMSATMLNKELHDLKVQYKQGEQWLLYRKYHDKGYTHSNTIDITRSDGRPDIRMRTKWTQKGRLFIYNLLKQEGILPVIEREGEPTG
jgi:anti-repressor protein